AVLDCLRRNERVDEREWILKDDPSQRSRRYVAKSTLRSRGYDAWGGLVVEVPLIGSESVNKVNATTTEITSQSKEDFDLEEINIDEDPKLAERYGYDIPVVLINGIKAFKHRVDPRDFKRKLKRLARQSQPCAR
ncbi:MAG TPA: glutaredoxin family protein, partial [Blastocatellia bacterium]|nr:glutaredoxin family protein [Blastocatellia bacterium]